MLSHTTIFIILAAMVIIGSSCDEVVAPFSEVPIDTHIVSGPEDGSVITDPSVSFQWEGSNKLVNEFSYRLIPRMEWSVWSADKFVTLGLAQGEYVFEVIGRYEPGKEDETPARVTFTVDIPGPGMLMESSEQKVNVGQEFGIDLVANDVEDLMLAHLILRFDPELLQVLKITEGSVFHIDHLPVFFAKIDNSGGIIDINMSTIGARPDRINGTEVIAIAKFRAISVGGAFVDFDETSEFRDAWNETIDIINRIGSFIEIVPTQRTQ